MASFAHIGRQFGCGACDEEQDSWSEYRSRLYRCWEEQFAACCDHVTSPRQTACWVDAHCSADELSRFAQFRQECAQRGDRLASKGRARWLEFGGESGGTCQEHPHGARHVWRPSTSGARGRRSETQRRPPSLCCINGQVDDGISESPRRAVRVRHLKSETGLVGRRDRTSSKPVFHVSDRYQRRGDQIYTLARCSPQTGSRTPRPG